MATVSFLCINPVLEISTDIKHHWGKYWPTEYLVLNRKYHLFTRYHKLMTNVSCNKNSNHLMFIDYDKLNDVLVANLVLDVLIIIHGGAGKYPCF